MSQPRLSSSAVRVGRPHAATLVDLLRARATDQASQRAYTFLLDGDIQSQSLTYAELDLQARSIAAMLQEIGAAGERALLIYPPGLEYIAAFFGCLYAGVTAVPAYPPHPAHLERSLPRLRTIVTNARPLVALTTATLAERAEAVFTHADNLGALRWLSTTGASADLAHAWQPPAINEQSLAFLQYTSGSTSAPKGVILSHDNLLQNLALIHQAFGHSTESRGVIWLPPYHDMGLIGGILQPLYGSFPVTLMSPVTFLQRPLRWLQAISRERATTSGGPNFAYDLCVRKIAPEQRALFDLSSWTVAFNGAEPIRADTLNRFADAFAPAGFRRTAFYPCYGLAEATLIVSGGEVSAPPVVQRFAAATLEPGVVDQDSPTRGDERMLVSSGYALASQTIMIVDAETCAALPDGQVGEIWVAGPSVAQGYWDRPVETARTFQAGLANGDPRAFLRTGDLGLIQDGELFVTGRLKDLIIIRGRNYYPQDIELTVERSHPALQAGGGAAFGVEAQGVEQLVVVQELERQHRAIDVGSVAEAIRRTVAEQHELQVYAVVLVRSGSIPKTSSGKIQRYACRLKYLDGSLNLIGASTLETEPRSAVLDAPQLTREALLAAPEAERQLLLVEYLSDRAARIIGIAAVLDPQRSISSFGLDSLMAVELQHTIESELGIAVPMVSFLHDTSITQLAHQMLALATTPSPADRPELVHVAEQDATYPLSAGQQALWFLHQLAPESAAYHLTFAATITSAIDIPALRHAFTVLHERHPVLRTSFMLHQGEPIQRVQESVQVWFDQEAADWTAAELTAQLLRAAHTPFDLEHGPLLRVTLFERPAQQPIMLLTIHHIVADLWSLSVLLHQLGVLYTAEQRREVAPLAQPRLHYTDYVRWQRALLAGPEGERLWNYWRAQLADAPTVLELPTDRPRPALQTYRGATEHFQLSATLRQHLTVLAHTHGTTLYTTLLAAFQTLLYRYTNQADFLIGSPTAGRSHPQIADTVGYFVNPVVVRARLAADQSFSSLLAQTRATVLAVLEHQDYPFAALVERLQPERDPSRSPLFQVMFILQKTQLADTHSLAAVALSQGGAQLKLGALTLALHELEQQVAQFDLTLSMAEVAGELAGALQYNADLFDAATIARMASHFQVLLEHIVADPSQPVVALPLLTTAERQQLMTWNSARLEYPAGDGIHHLVEKQTARTPDAVALIDGDTRVTYRELNQRANQLAHTLQRRGIGPETPVGVCVDRSVEMVVSLLAILKAGGAYVPLDPAYPPDRLQFMLHDAQAPLLITRLHLSERLLAGSAQVMCVDADWPSIDQAAVDNPRAAVRPDNLAYVIYTSGSTGRPKGVMITHGSAVAMLEWARTTFTQEQCAGVLAATSICFDLSVFELFVPLSRGGTVILARSALDLPTLTAANEVTLVNTVPSAITELLRIDGLPGSVRTVNLAGEALRRNLVQQLYQRPSIQQVFNLYGPSEDTTYSSFALVSRGSDAPPPIGRPLANTQMYVLDQRMEPVPIGVVGELYISGDGLARGYFGQSALTAERFIPSPFGDQPGARMYRTGDLVRYLPDGAIEFLGRIDHQIKLRGYRIELGEIEAAVLRYPGVARTAVLAREDVPGDMRLVAYIVMEESGMDVLGVPQAPEGAQHGNSDPALQPSELRAFLKAQLPEYMVPSAVMVLPALPLTPNGKLDRKRLPVPDTSRPLLDTAVVAPRTPLEQRLAELWCQLLNLEQVGIDDNFFALGGHSLLAVQLLSRMPETFQIDVPIQCFFEAPTIAGLSKNIEMIMWARQNTALPTTSADDREEGSF